ncbi:DUF6392 family protein [Pseudomonas putida]|uniref:Pyocin immunity protein n=1 Tax=Pseudomonas putida TaxID=303 RepID=A0A177SRS7_PSEPU|nr:DUF6392 family protein [Pseudomonas putida]OAI93676.1 hypothetical protein AYO28_13125 [Pseudomonas putida]
MKKGDIDKIVGFLGRPYAELAAENIFPEVEFSEIYPGSESVYILPEEGLGLDFLAENKVLKALHITLKETYEGTSVYKGELPEIFFPGMDQEMVLDLFGEPVSSGAPVLMPVPIGQTGGWAFYVYDDELFPGVLLQFQYAADMQVKTVVFALK